MIRDSGRAMAQLHTRVEPETKTELERIAARQKITLSELYRRALDEYIDRHRVPVVIAGPELLDVRSR